MMKEKHQGSMAFEKDKFLRYVEEIKHMKTYCGEGVLIVGNYRFTDD